MLIHVRERDNLFLDVCGHVRSRTHVWPRHHLRKRGYVLVNMWDHMRRCRDLCCDVYGSDMRIDVWGHVLRSHMRGHMLRCYVYIDMRGDLLWSDVHLDVRCDLWINLHARVYARQRHSRRARGHLVGHVCRPAHLRQRRRLRC
jgi:hypothetical protein